MHDAHAPRPIADAIPGTDAAAAMISTGKQYL